MGARAQPSIEEQSRVFQDFPSLAESMGVTGLRDAEVALGGVPDCRVVLLFSHVDFAGVRFGYRCKPPGEDRYEEVWLAEELATGALHRTMRSGAPSDEAGTVWLRLHGQRLGADDDVAPPNDGSGRHAGRPSRG